jgi:hypothetical protein
MVNEGRGGADHRELNAAIVKALDDENVRKRLLELGSVIPGPADRSRNAGSAPCRFNPDTSFFRV